MSKLQYKIEELERMKKYPDELNYIGNLELLKRKKVSIVGSRHPNQYTKIMTQDLAKKLSLNGICIVSGGAMGVDAIAHKSAGVDNTIMVAGTGIDIRYPKIHSKPIQEIEEKDKATKTGNPQLKFPLQIIL